MSFYVKVMVPKTFTNIKKMSEHGFKPLSLFLILPVPCGVYASSQLSLKLVVVMSLEQLCGALSNIINEPL